MSEENAGAPALDITQTPEFREAVAKAAAEAASKAVEEVLSRLPAPAPAAPPDMSNMGEIMNALALSIANLNAHNTGEKPVDPEVVKRREIANEEMWTLIRAARAEGKTAIWRLKGKVFFDEQVVEHTFVNKNREQEPQEIDWLLPPNQSMSPVNDTAKAIYAAYERSIAGTIRPVREAQPFFMKGGLVVRGEDGKSPNMAELGGTADEIRAGLAVEQVALSGLRVHQENAAGYVTQQILGSTPAGRAVVQR